MYNYFFVEKIYQSSSNYSCQLFSIPNKIYTCVNPFSYHMVRCNQKLYEQMDGLFVDGMLMCCLICVLWRKKVYRLSFDMTGIALDLFLYLNDENIGKNIYFIGTRQNILEDTIKQIRKDYPKMNIAGYRNGYFVDIEDRNKSISEIVKLNSSFVVVGLGSPLQEQFALDLKNAGYQGIVFTCGGFLHQSAKNMNYYPGWINKYNLRAFYRIFHEKGMLRRLHHVLIEFPILFTWDTFITKIKGIKKSYKM